jgi:geranylgeranyl diphosphate synthase, type II
MRYSLLAGGKRIRPVLTLAGARALGADPADVLPTAAAIELVHTYSLIHDDLPAMDDDDLRRGRPTCHIAFGENVAILAGDGLMAEAYRLILERQAGEPARLLAALRELSDAIGVDGMVGGQYVDVAGDPDLDGDSLRGMHAMKTGKLIAAAIGVAPLLLGAPDGARIALARFASEVGLLYQIVDDILDVTGSEEEMGKASGTDERLGKRTYVSVFGLERARELASRSHAGARAALDEARKVLPAEPRDLELMTDFMYSRNT